MSFKERRAINPLTKLTAEYYIGPDVVNNWEGSKTEFAYMVKDFLVQYVDKSVKPFVKKLPFLRLPTINSLSGGENCVVKLAPEIGSFLATRRVLAVYAWRRKDFKGNLVPLTSEEALKITGKINARSGFKINIALAPAQQMLTTFSHEIGHTFFYDITKDPPRCFVPKELMSNPACYRAFEGLAFDLGREILLPREKFSEVVLASAIQPSIEKFLNMRRELHVSTEVLAQRLVKDTRLLKNCAFFWGKTCYEDFTLLGKTLKGPHISVGHRGIRNGGLKLNLKRELAIPSSPLTKAVLAEKDERKIYKSEVNVGKETYLLEIWQYRIEEQWTQFLALLYKGIESNFSH